MTACGFESKCEILFCFAILVQVTTEHMMVEIVMMCVCHLAGFLNKSRSNVLWAPTLVRVSMETRCVCLLPDNLQLMSAAAFDVKSAFLRVFCNQLTKGPNQTSNFKSGMRQCSKQMQQPLRPLHFLTLTFLLWPGGWTDGLFILVLMLLLTCCTTLF